MSLPRITMEDLEPIPYKVVHEYLSFSMTVLITVVVFLGILISILLFKTITNKNNFNCGTLIINDEFKARDVFKAKKGNPIFSNLYDTVKNTEGGILKRIDENRELLDLLNIAAPDFISNHQWVVGWFKSQDDFLLKLANELRIKIPSEETNYPRPFNGNSSWMDDKTLVVERYMTNEQIGRLVNDYMVKTNGMPLKIVFPEYDKGSDQ